MKSFKENEIQEIITKYQNGISRNKLKQEYNCSDNKILRILKDNNIPIRTVKAVNSKRKYNINDDYFDKQEPNMAYILGFWAADGNVSSTENRLDLELSSQDIEILEQIRKELNSERPIKIYECANGYNKNKLLFWSSKIKQTFIEYGIVPNKTYSEDFHAPYKLDKKYWIDYIRGFFDGDGSVKESNGTVSFELNSINKNFLEDLKVFLEEKYNIITKISTTGMKNRRIPMYRLYCYGENTRKIFSILYTENALFLKRKKDKFSLLLK